VTDSARLDGQVAIVTGAAQGIGRGIATVLAAAGAAVVIGDLQLAGGTVAAVEALGGRAVAMEMDVASPEGCAALVEHALEVFGRLDVLVNNAAIDAPPGPWDLPDGEWRRTLGVNLDGVFYASRAAAREMLAAGGGAIVNIASHAAWMPGADVSPAYGASKAGVLGLTMSFAAQLAGRGVRVNAVAPALVASRDFGWTPEESERRLAEYPLGAGRPEDIGEAVRYLASPAARWVTGTVLYLHGGHRRSGPWT
jgi:meso-butanediol dehydrogenase / (S,S)-butanediol dehydrogenase / diacetyl reductase